MKSINKNAFTLFEVLISAVLLFISISIIIKLSSSDNSKVVYKELQTAQNQFEQNQRVSDTQNIKFEHH